MPSSARIRLPGALLATLLLLAPLALVPATSADPASPPKVDATGAAEWVGLSRWSDLGLFVDGPDHAVMPRESWHALRALGENGALSRVNATAAAEAAVRLQDPYTGGFRAFADQPLWIFVEDTHYAIELARAHGIPFDEEKATAFLLAHRYDGGFQPRVNRAPNPLATYQALTALDRMGALNETVRTEAASFLLRTQKSDGGWTFTGDPNDPNTAVQPTFYAVAALAHLNALDATTADRVATFIRSMERPLQGGFREYGAGGIPTACVEGFCPNVEETTVGSTYHALRALEVLGELDDLQTPFLHASWIAARQVSDGPFAGAFDWYEGYKPPHTNYALSTSMGLHALRLLGSVESANVEAAVAFLAAAQHDGTGGWAWWNGHLATNKDTEAALRALALLGDRKQARPAALAATYASIQRDDGSIPDLHWSAGNVRLDHAAWAVLALSHVNRVSAINVDAAIAYFDSQAAPGGGYIDPMVFPEGPSPHATYLAVLALRAIGALDHVDAPATAQYLASVQKPDGRISEEDYRLHESLRDTREAIETLALLGRLDAIDGAAAARFMASRQAPDGTWYDLMEAALAVLGLRHLGALDHIDTAATIGFLAAHKTARGGFSEPGFPPIGSPNERHAAAIESLLALGALHIPAPPAIPPVFDPRADLDGATGRALTLTVRATHPEGEAVALALAEAPAGATLTSAGGEGTVAWTPTHRQAGEHALRLRATSESGGVAYQNLTLRIADASSAPLAGFTLPAHARPGQVLTATDTSRDPDGGAIVARAWTWGDGATGTGARPTHSYAAPGLYTVTLTVTDDEGVNATATRAVLVDGAAPAAAATLAGTTKRDVYVDEATVHLNATDDASGSGVGSIRYRLNGTLGSLTGNGSVRINASGTHTLDYWAVDRAGNAGPEQRVTFTVDAEGPTTEILTPGSLSLSGRVTFQADVADAVAGVTRVEFLVDGHRIATFREGGLLTTTRTIGTGAHTFQVVATDAVGHVTSTETEFFVVWVL